MNGLCRGGIVILLLVVPYLVSASDNNVRLVAAVKDTDYEAVKSLLQQSVDVNFAMADGSTALHWAAYRDSLETADLLLQSGANASPSNDYGVTPLWLACTNRSNQMVKKLLQAGADPNASMWTGETVLMKCAQTGSANSVAALLTAGAKVNSAESNNKQTALMWAVAGAYPDVTQLLINHGADINATTISTYTTIGFSCRVCAPEPYAGEFTPLLFAARSGDLESARLLIEAGADPNVTTARHGNALVIASAGGHEDMVRYLLEMGTDPNSADENGITSLHHAVGTGLSFVNGVLYDPVYRIRPSNSLKLVKALLESGANVNAQITSDQILGPEEYAFTMTGATPFLLAAASADVPIMRLLHDFGADLQLNTDEGITPLIAAAQYACTGTCAFQGQGKNISNNKDIELALQAVKALVEMGVELNATDKSGRTAMHLAAFTGADAVVQYLAEQGAQVDVKNKNGETPWTMASGIKPGRGGEYGIHESTAELLVKLGATPEVNFDRR